MRSFENISKLIRERRMGHPQGLSQSELSQILGYKNGQFISNVERGLCSVPLKMLRRVSEVLSITEEELKDALLKDYQNTIEDYFKIENAKVRSPATVRRRAAEMAMGPQISA